jgi:YbbR domain-containing protein
MDWMRDNVKVLKEYARDYVLEHTGLKVLALLITAVLWLSVASRPVSQVALTGQIVFKLPESPSLIVSKADTATARVFVEGPRDVLDALQTGQLSVTANITSVEPGLRVVTLEIEPNRLPASVKVKAIDPQKVRVTVERVIEKEAPIVPRFEGEPPPGYQVVDWQITPATVQIGGAESQVQQMTEVTTETVRLTDKTEAFSQQVAIDIGSPNLSISNDAPSKVTLTVNIGEVRKERIMENVPVALFGAPLRARVIPRLVRLTVYGPHSAVDALTVADFNVAVEYQPGSHIFTPKVTLSPAYADRVVVRTVEPQKVQVK